MFSVVDVPLQAAILRNLGLFNVRGLAGTAWALAILEDQDVSLVNALVSKAFQDLRCHAAEWEAQSLAAIAWSVASLEVQHDSLMEAVVESEADFSSFTVHEVGMLSWALCAWSPHFAWRFVRRLQSFNRLDPRVVSAAIGPLLSRLELEDDAVGCAEALQLLASCCPPAVETAALVLAVAGEAEGLVHWNLPDAVAAACGCVVDAKCMAYDGHGRKEFAPCRTRLVSNKGACCKP